MTVVTNFYSLPKSFKAHLKAKKPNFGFNGFGEVIYYRTYSRIMKDGSQESFADTIIRVIEGVISIRKDAAIKRHLQWKDEEWHEFACDMAEYAFSMKFLPSGRGLWAMGTNYIYTKGSAALFNCGATDTKDLAEACEWTADFLMCGTGVGYNTKWEGEVFNLDDKLCETFVIPDSREGWAESIRKHIETYTVDASPIYSFDYSKVRGKGEPIRGFGGISSGPAPLIKLHSRIDKIFIAYIHGEIDKTRVVADIMCSIGACIVSGNVRRSATLALGSIDDDTFLNLKNYEKFPDRAEIGWMSNNSVVLDKREDFLKLPAIVSHILDNGEPGVINLMNIQKYGRVRYGEERIDRASLVNPCGEIPLEDKELCNLAEVFPTKCENLNEYYQALKYATFYTTTVALLPTHNPKTNSVIARNRRIGVSISGIADWIDQIGAAELTRNLRDGYKIVKQYNKELSMEMGVPNAIRLSTLKPSGSISLLSGVSPGMHFPTFRYAIRRVRISKQSKICNILQKAGIPNEKDFYSDETQVFEFPIDQGKTRQASEVSAWEQFSLLGMLQREWADNSVSVTIYFDKDKEADQIERMLLMNIPIIKTVSLLPHSVGGSYKQMPYEGITEDEYIKRLESMPKIDWSELTGSDGIDSKFCTNESCVM